MRSSNPIREWAILAALWWLAWAPLSATILLRMSRGYSFRRLGLTILLLPTLFTILWALLRESHKIALLTLLNKSVGYPVIISTIGLVILLFILNRSTSFVRLTLATLCVSLDHTCLRLPLRLVRGIMYLISITTVMYLVLGLKPIYWFAVLAILPTYIIYVGRSLLLIKNSLITK